ncbi:MAG: TetM/TetW/TetO/TetS family tetracycline resistance ribosomal protection protein, partial [Erysipelotrichaceae bacterium]|nr:TetM/TetW/TetO/TetS family tetracycline resistance ribosomal protection protein [Erysipelotrichaceae bacterium]
MKRIVTGILAHVDAGKTTCIESMLYNAGKLRMMGRVDHKDAYLDYDSQERDRGITIYSKEANYTWKDAEIYLIDTPGHVDFSSEMERSLQILDLAILLINGMDGVQSHTETIWKCLQHYHVPTLIFINKMDITYMEKEQLLHDLQTKCSSNCIAFNQSDTMEQLALVNEPMLNQFMETGDISLSMIQEAVLKRECFPCFFGSALKNNGITDLMDAIVTCSFQREYPKEFAARAYKISTDAQGNRLTHMKITGGSLAAKQKINDEEKVDKIWIYNGPDRQAVQQVQAGMVCAVKGLHSIQAGQPLGAETDTTKPVLSACLRYQLLLPEGVDALEMMQTCRQLAAEDPQLQIEFDEQSKKIHIQLMGAIQMEVLQNQIYQRSKVHVGFQSGQVLYRETIAKPVLGIGHFEPLRHYAEVLLQLEPLPAGSGLVFESQCSQDQLALNWQRLILTHLQERTHKGVLTGSPITDMKITLLAGIAHVKHTEGGDFRQATYRAVRQGLKKAESVLLEPYYSFKIQVPQD